MNWIKDAVLDVIILLFIVVFAYTYNNILEVVLWVYTGLLLLSKILALFMPSLQRRASKTQVPPLFYHIIYALTVGVFIYIEHYYFTGAWLLVWLLSVWNERSSSST